MNLDGQGYTSVEKSSLKTKSTLYGWRGKNMSLRVAVTTAQRMNAVVRQKAQNESESTPSSDDEDEELADDFHTRTVVFKCIGAAKERRPQAVLSEASYKFRRGEAVEVRLLPEPSNPWDSRAIAFQFKVGANWERIGYVVREALNAVHSAIQTGSIISVKFEWIRFITH